MRGRWGVGMTKDSQRIDTLPDSFGRAFKSGYLGDPEQVSALVGAFCAAIDSLLQDLGAGSVSQARFVELSQSLVRRYADVFAGRNPEYRTIAGYNERTLPIKLKVDLGEFWQSHRQTWNDDPLCVLFEWLFVHVAEAVKRADGDDALLGIMLRPAVEGAVKTLLGVEKRLRG